MNNSNINSVGNLRGGIMGALQLAAEHDPITPHQNPLDWRPDKVTASTYAMVPIVVGSSLALNCAERALSVVNHAAQVGLLEKGALLGIAGLITGLGYMIAHQTLAENEDRITHRRYRFTKEGLFPPWRGSSSPA